jgi:hypothetical protein
VLPVALIYRRRKRRFRRLLSSTRIAWTSCGKTALSAGAVPLLCFRRALHARVQVSDPAIRAIADALSQAGATKSPQRNVKRTSSVSDSPALFPKSPSTGSTAFAHSQSQPFLSNLSLAPAARRDAPLTDNPSAASPGTVDAFLCPISFVTETTRKYVLAFRFCTLLDVFDGFAVAPAVSPFPVFLRQQRRGRDPAPEVEPLAQPFLPSMF